MKITHKLSAGFIFCAGLWAYSAAVVQAAAEVPKTAFVHLFEWHWSDIATECEDFLGPKGFAAVQISPPQKSIDNAAWWSRYQPVSYQFDSRSGNREQFKDMVQRCNAAGVSIYLDAVINHMAAWNRSFPDVPYSTEDFHNCRDNIDYSNRWQVQNCDLVGLNDLKTESEYVRQKIADYMNDAISMGVAGFRIDAAKHIPATDIAAIKSKLHTLADGNPPYIFQEVIGASGEPVQPSEYTDNGGVTEFNFARTIGSAFKNGKINTLKSLNQWSGWLPSDKAVVFVTNHDDERGNAGNELTYKDQGNLYMLGHVFMLAYPYGYPKIMSGYKFNSSDDAPPSAGVHSGNACDFNGGDWVCTHEWRGVGNMVAFRNYTAAQWKVTNWWDNGSNQIAFGRGGLGFVVINRADSGTLTHTFSTGMPEGDYCNIIDGDFDSTAKTCSGETIHVDGQGNAQFSVGYQGAAAIHVGASLGGIVIPPVTGPEPEKAVRSTAMCYYDQSAGFTTPYLYYWKPVPASAMSSVAWPGVAMEKNGDFYCYDPAAEVTSVNVIFSDQGASQTEDLSASSGSCYLNGAWKSLSDCGFSLTDEPDDPQASENTRVCYDNAQNFSSPYLYFWNVAAASAVNTVAWPGVAMSADGNSYCYDFGTELSSLNVIFSDNGSGQTADLSAFSPDLCYLNGSWQDLSLCINQ
ncbi:Alpha-amylase precursor [Vibrio aerogenes CECT 7868]|uniref:Alpha-amylase n=1 Tax=Vibrio aerogenes CECT 7868 TaxID=1216006 RepID=A0A1M6BTM9_9VIBR|nr:starch-binding protein [Vibrio aerogenes]SHI52142.1 Alpha-amylase precursor [Vibrio aerogenes CECT 7868]